MNYTYQQGLDSENMTELCNSPLIIKAVLHLKWWLVNHFRGVWIRVLCQTDLIVNSSKYIMIGNLLLIVMLPDVCLLTCTLDLYVVMPTLWSNKPVLSNREKLIRKCASKWMVHKEFLEGIQSAAHALCAWNTLLYLYFSKTSLLTQTFNKNLGTAYISKD